jgi:hypothetical protein
VKLFKNENGVVTMEACIVVPAFVLLMLLMNGLFLMFMGQQIIAHAAVQSTKSLALDPYAIQRVEGNEQDQLADLFVDLFSVTSKNHTSTSKWYEGDVADEVEDRFMAYLAGSGKVDALLELVGVENGRNGLDFSGSTVEDGVLTVKIAYTQNFVYAASDLTSIDREITLKVKLFQYKQA